MRSLRLELRNDVKLRGAGGRAEKKRRVVEGSKKQGQQGHTGKGKGQGRDRLSPQSESEAKREGSVEEASIERRRRQNMVRNKEIMSGLGLEKAKRALFSRK